MDYKKYPYLPHQDPNSPEYIHSELDEYHDEAVVTSYNTVIDNFKHDLKVQREVWQAISNLDRPYKHGIRGIDTNIYEDGPVKPKLEDLGFERQDLNDQEFGFSNEDRFIANTPFHKKHNFQHIKQWEQERLNRPVTKHFNPKGYKYDVEMKPEEKYQFVADRLGHPEFLGTPVDRLFKLENDIFHPTYLDQPFVQTPNAKPNANLNFEQGEVLYENTRVLEWVRFIQLFGLTAGAYIALYVPFSLGYKTNLVTDAADELINNQYHLVSPTTVDILRLSIPIGVGAIAYTVYGLLNYTNSVTSQYVVKMSYSKDKVFSFFIKNRNFFSLRESIFTVSLMKKFMKLLIWKLFHQPKDLVLLISAHMMRMVFGESLTLTLANSCWPTTTRTTGIFILETNSSKKYLFYFIKDS